MTATGEAPEVGDISQDGLFRWDGQSWLPLARGRREPTSWTTPLQRAVAVFFAVYAVEQVVTYALFYSVPALERSLKAQNPALPADEARASAELGFAVGWVTTAVLALAVLLLAGAGLRRWRWVFWLDLVALGLCSIGVIGNLLALVNLDPRVQMQPAGVYVAGLLLSLAALTLLGWFVVAAVRFGPWAMRPAGATRFASEESPTPP